MLSKTQLSLVLAVLATFTPLAESIATVENNCGYPLFIWSVPGIQKPIVIQPGTRYEEIYRPGTQENPGVAIKVSTDANGIHRSKDEIDFQYAIDKKDRSQVWINLHTLRPHAYENGITFSDCMGEHTNIASTESYSCPISTQSRLTLCGNKNPHKVVRDASNKTTQATSTITESASPDFAHWRGKCPDYCGFDCRANPHGPPKPHFGLTLTQWAEPPRMTKRAEKTGSATNVPDVMMCSCPADMPEDATVDDVCECTGSFHPGSALTQKLCLCAGDVDDAVGDVCECSGSVDVPV